MTHQPEPAPNTWDTFTKLFYYILFPLALLTSSFIFGGIIISTLF